MLTTDLEIRAVREHEAKRLAATIALALAADPATRWAVPDGDRYVNVMLAFVIAFGGKVAIERGTAFVIGDFLGAAIWVPPDAGVDEEATGAIFARYVEEPHLSAVFALFEKMSDHHPKEAHWYLPLIGVDLPNQGRGLGSALMKHSLALCDRDRLPAYLEATSRTSVPFYQRHGFELIAEITAGSSPPMFPMLRRPR